MVLAIVDDLLFMSKIRGAAGRAGVPLTTARSAEGALDEMRRQPPALVIVDLNNRRADPLATIVAMKADPLLRSVRTLAFAGHTQLDLLESAKRAGVDDVLTRGALNELLPEIFSKASAREAGA